MGVFVNWFSLKTGSYKVCQMICDAEIGLEPQKPIYKAISIIL